MTTSTRPNRWMAASTMSRQLVRCHIGLHCERLPTGLAHEFGVLDQLVKTTASGNDVGAGVGARDRERGA
jgi:hypothetical protein